MTRIEMPYGDESMGPSRGRGMGAFKMRILIALVLAAIAFFSYYSRPGDVNPVTGERQRVAFEDEADEIRMGLQAVPQMAGEFGGADRDGQAQARVKQVGERLLKGLDDSLEPGGHVNPYRNNFEFTLLADPKTINAFALPGGKVFITRGLYRELETEGQLAGVLGHEIGHVIERHSNQQMAKQKLFSGLAAAGGVAGGNEQSARMAQAAAQLVSMKYGREDENQADEWGVRLTTLAGYDPRAMIGVMEILAKASAGHQQPEFFSTHPNPGNREAHLKALIEHEFPNGMPKGLEP